jgi:hypothetical protein
MGKISSLRDQITARGGSWMQAWKEEELQKELDKLPELVLPRRRAAAMAGESKRKGEDVDPALEAQSNEKKQKELEELRGINDDIDGNEPSEALIAACEAVLGKRKKRTTSSEVWTAVKLEYKVTGKSGYGPRHCLSDATRLLHERYEGFDDAAKRNSPLRWLDASAQTKRDSQLPEGKKKRDDEVDAMATEVATAVAAARMAKIKHSFYGRKAVELAGTTLGLHAEHTLVEVLRATTVQDALRWDYAPPWLTQGQVAVLWRVLAKVPPSTPLYDIKEGALVPTGLPRVDFWIALSEPIAALAALWPCFASLGPLVDYMLPVHVKKNRATFGPGGGVHADALLTSGVEDLARRFLNRRSSIVRGPDALLRSGDHIYTPEGASLDRLPGPNEGIIANVSLEMKNGELAVAGAFIGDTYRELYDFGDDNTGTVTTFTPEAAKAGHGDARDCERFKRENAFGHAVAAAFVAAVLNVAELARVSSWVLRDAFVNPPPPFVRELYQDEKAVEWGQHAGVGPAFELATRAPMVAADVRLEFSRTGGAHDSALVASPYALLPRLTTGGARLEWKAVIDGAPRVVHGAGGLVGTARWCDIVVWTDIGSGASAIRAEDVPFCEANLEGTLKEVHDLHVILDALGSTDARDKAYGKFLKKSAVLRKVRLGFCFVGDLDKKGHPLEAQTRRVSFDADWDAVKAAVRAAIDYCLVRRDQWRVATPGVDEQRRLGPRVPTADPIKLVVPTGNGVAADIYQSAPPAPPLVVQPHGTAGGLADVPKPPRLRTPKARLAPWKESVESIAAPRPKKKRRK